MIEHLASALVERTCEQMVEQSAWLMFEVLAYQPETRVLE